MGRRPTGLGGGRASGTLAAGRGGSHLPDPVSETCRPPGPAQVAKLVLPAPVKQDPPAQIRTMVRICRGRHRPVRPGWLAWFNVRGANLERPGCRAGVPELWRPCGPYRAPGPVADVLLPRLPADGSQRHQTGRPACPRCRGPVGRGRVGLGRPGGGAQARHVTSRRSAIRSAAVTPRLGRPSRAAGNTTTFSR